MQSSMHCTAMSACSGSKNLNTAVFVVQALVESLHVHFLPMQSFLQTSGFASLMSLEELAIVACSQLQSIDGLSRLTTVDTVILIQHSTRLCYLLDSNTADAAFWQVRMAWPERALTLQAYL